MIFDKSVYSIIILLYASLLTPTNEMNGTQIDYFHLFLGSFFWPKCQKKIGLLDWKKNQGFSIETHINSHFPTELHKKHSWLVRLQSDINPKTG